MAAKEITVWGIHGGRTGDTDHLFLRKNFIALGWPKMGDLSLLKPDRDAYKACMAQACPEGKPGAVPVNAGQLFRFIHELKVGEIVVYPSRRDKLIHIGKVEGEYRYNPAIEPEYPNARPVKWLKALPRTSFTQGALYEIGAAMSFFQVKTYADEYLAALEGRTVPTPVEDETVALVAEDIEQITRDFILKRLSQELKGHPLAHFIAHLLQTMGYRTRVSPEGPDGGIEIIAHKDELGFEPPIIKVQVKSGSGSIGDPVISTLYGKLSGGEHALLVTLSTFTTAARNFAESKSNFLAILNHELPSALRQLQQGTIAPVDLAQAAIDPGMAVFSRYKQVLEADGLLVRVRTALAIINQALDEFLAEQEGEYDCDTRWALAWYEQYGHEQGPYGMAETLSKAKNTSVEGLVEAGFLEARAGKVRLLRRDELDLEWDPQRDKRPTAWEACQHLIYELEKGGEQTAAALLAILGSLSERARDLAYRLYTVCERKGWAQDELGFNILVVAWPRIKELAGKQAWQEKLF